MLSESAVKMLKWFNENDNWWCEAQIERAYPAFDYRAFDALRTEKYIHSVETDDVDITEYNEIVRVIEYQISDAGRAYLEAMPERNFDKWLTRIIAIWGAITGTIALVLELAQRFL